MEDASHPENWNGYWKSFRTFISMAAKQAAGDWISRFSPTTFIS